jgi:hypothetical protein
MRSINKFANGLPRSYATAENAKAAFDKVCKDASERWPHAGHLIHQRADGRFVNIVINPDPLHFALFANNGIGVWS